MAEPIKKHNVIDEKNERVVVVMYILYYVFYFMIPFCLDRQCSDFVISECGGWKATAGTKKSVHVKIIAWSYDWFGVNLLLNNLYCF